MYLTLTCLFVLQCLITTDVVISFHSIRGMFEMNCLFLSGDFKLAQKYSFRALEVLPVARNAKFQPMYPLLEGVTVR